MCKLKTYTFIINADFMVFFMDVKSAIVSSFCQKIRNEKKRKIILIEVVFECFTQVANTFPLRDIQQIIHPVIIRVSLTGWLVALRL